MRMLKLKRSTDHHSGDQATVVVHGKQDRASADDQALKAALDDPHEDSDVERAANYAEHCDQPGSPGYRPETADQP